MNDGASQRYRSYWLDKKGKREFIPRWYAVMEEATLFNERRIKRKDQIQYYLSDLAQGFIPDEEEEGR